MRLYGLRAEHDVNVIRDGKHGKSGSAVVSGGLEGFYHVYNEDDDEDKPYSDVVMFPISIDSAKQVPIFRRERLVRECAIVRVASISIEETKWYQKGIFKVIMVIVSLVIAYFYPPAGVSMLVSLLTTAAIMVVLYIASQVIDNPYLLALIQIIAIAYGGYSGGTLTVNPAMLVEAAGVVVNTAITIQMIELQAEIKEWQKMVNEKQEEYDKMKEEVGLDEFNAEWMLYVAGLTPSEEPEEFFERTLKSELPGTETALVEVESKLPSRK
jgi:hypothetical protein